MFLTARAPKRVDERKKKATGTGVVPVNYTGQIKQKVQKTFHYSVEPLS